MVEVGTQLAKIDTKQALMALLPGQIATAIFNIPDELLLMDEKELESRLTSKKKFTLVDHRLKIAFWTEYAGAAANMRQMNATKIYAGVCSRQEFYTRLLPDKARLSYLLLPPKDYDVAMAEFLEHAVDRLRSAFEKMYKEFSDSKSPKAYECLMKTTQMLIQFTKGEPMRRIEQKNLNLNANVPAGATGAASGAQPLEAIEAEIKKLEAEDAIVIGERSMPGPDPSPSQ